MSTLDISINLKGKEKLTLVTGAVEAGHLLLKYRQKDVALITGDRFPIAKLGESIQVSHGNTSNLIKNVSSLFKCVSDVLKY